MTLPRRHQLRAYSTVVAVWSCLATPALSLDADTVAVMPPREAARAELIEALLRDQPLGYFSLGSSSAWRETDRAASEESELDIVLDDVAWSGELLSVRVDPHVQVRQLYVTLPDVSKKRVQLALNRKTGLYEGKILVPFSYARDELTVRIVARDQTSKQLEREIVLPVLFDGC